MLFVVRTCPEGSVVASAQCGQDREYAFLEIFRRQPASPKMFRRQPVTCNLRHMQRHSVGACAADCMLQARDKILQDAYVKTHFNERKHRHMPMNERQDLQYSAGQRGNRRVSDFLRR